MPPPVAGGYDWGADRRHYRLAGESIWNHNGSKRLVIIDHGTRYAIEDDVREAAMTSRCIAYALAGALVASSAHAYVDETDETTPSCPPPAGTCQLSLVGATDDQTQPNISVAVFSSHCAYAQLNWSLVPILPPVEYDHPYSGQLTITRLKTEDEVRERCIGATFNFGRAVGCNLRYVNWRCDIFIASDEVLATVGLDYETTLRHEIGHCNGWPGDHRGARYLNEPYPGAPPPTGRTPPFLQFPK